LVWLGAGGAALALCGFALASRITADAAAVEKT
jgi:hypothetical protein